MATSLFPSRHAKGGAKTAPSKWPGALAKKKDIVFALMADGQARRAAEGSTVGLFQRVGRKRGKRHLEPVWVTKDAVHVEAR